MKLEVGQRFRCLCKKGVLLLPDLGVPWEKVDVFEAERLWLWGTGQMPVRYSKIGPWEVVPPRPLGLGDRFWMMADEGVAWAAQLVVDGLELVPLVYELVVIQVRDLDDPAAEVRVRSGDVAGAGETVTTEMAEQIYQALGIPVKYIEGDPGGDPGVVPKGYENLFKSLTEEVAQSVSEEKEEPKAPEPPPKPGGRKVSWE